MNRRFVLHLGLWKSGTTTIQSFLRGNPRLLADNGVYYPQVGPENADHPFFSPKPATEFMAQEVSHQFLGRELAGRKRRSLTDLPLWTTAFRLIEASGAHTAIISYEDFSAQVPLYRFDAIAERLKTFDVVGIIYLRPQEPWAVSLYSHFVRGARTSLSFQDFVDSIRHRLTYSELLDRICANIPLDRMIVRNFDEASTKGLIQDFFQSLDLSDALSAMGGDDSIRNRSLPHWAVLFMLECMQLSLPAELLNDVRKVVIRTAASGRSISLNPGLDLANPAERAALRAVMSADAGRLADRYGITFSAVEPAAIAYRPFDRNDFNAIRKAIGPRLAAHTRAALDDV